MRLAFVLVLIVSFICLGCGGETISADASVDAAPDVVNEASVDAFPNVLEPCGIDGAVCASATGYCEYETIGDAQDEDGSVTPVQKWFCHPLPTGCQSCACLKDAGYPGLACTNMTYGFGCSDKNGIVRISDQC